MHPYTLERIKGIPELNSFISQVNEIISNDFPHSFWNCKNVFENLVKSDFVTDLINYELSCLVDESLYAVNDSFTNGFFIVQTDQFRLAVQAFGSSKDPDSRKLAKSAIDDRVSNKEMLYAASLHQMIGVHGSGSFEIERYKQDNPYPIEILDKNKYLTQRELIEVNSSEIRCFKAHEDVIRIIEPSEVCIVFYFMTRDLGSIRWAYDLDTLKPSRAIATSMNSSRLQWAADTLVELECINAVPALEHLYGHPDHFVRWSAISNLIQLDSQKGTLLLEKASLNDVHPHVRNAARKSLEMLRDQPIQ